jgi:hypothetical protein
MLVGLTIESNCSAVTLPEAEVQQRRGRPFGHSTVAVRCAGHHTLEQGEHGAHLRHRIEARHEVHLRGARVGEADIHAAANQCADKGLCTIHGIRSRVMGLGLESIS